MNVEVLSLQSASLSSNKKRCKRRETGNDKKYILNTEKSEEDGKNLSPVLYRLPMAVAKAYKICSFV